MSAKIMASQHEAAKGTMHQLVSVGNEKLPQLPRARGGMSGQEQATRKNACNRETTRMMKIRVVIIFIIAQVALAK